MVLLASTWMEWLSDWFNYPGLEAWKFANLAIFTGLALYVSRRKVSEALLARREAIRQELFNAQAEREKAQTKLAEAKALLERLESDVLTVREHAQQEAKSERERLMMSMKREIEKLELQAQREIDMTAKVARKQLRQFLAMRSVQLAEESVRRQLRPEDDTRLIKENIGELRRAQV
jgi:F0F1-type ATP synthase membrane subunit b/b'